MRAHGMRGEDGGGKVVSNPMLAPSINVLSDEEDDEEVEFEEGGLGEAVLVAPISLKAGPLPMSLPMSQPSLSGLEKIVESRAFAALEVGLILATIWGLGLDSPAFPPDQAGKYLVTSIEVVTSTVWTVQMLLKVAAATPSGYLLSDEKGTGQNKVRFLNLLDLWVVVTSWLAMVDSLKAWGFGTMRLLRLARAVPLMRVWSSELADLIDSLIGSVVMLLDVVIFICFVIFMFGIVGLHIFQGALSHRCAADQVEAASNVSISCPGTFACDLSVNPEDMCVPRSPPVQVADKENYGFYGFDSLIQSTFVVFEQISLDGGFHDLPQLISTTDVGSSAMAWNFFMAVVVVLNVLVLNLFVAVVVSAFDETRASRAAAAAREAYLEAMSPSAAAGEGISGSSDSGMISPLSIVAGAISKDPLTSVTEAAGELRDTATDLAKNLVAPVGEGDASPRSNGSTSPRSGDSSARSQDGASDELDAAEARRQSKELRGLVPGSGAEKMADLLYAITNNKIFSLAVLGVIFANVVVLCLYHEGMDPLLRLACASAETTFLFLFSIEAALKIIGMGWRDYWADGLNKCDFGVLVVSTCGILVNIFVSHTGVDQAPNLSALRVLRLTRLVSAMRVIYRYDSVRMVVQTAFQSLSQLLALCFLMVFCIIFFALAGMHLYGDTCDTCTEVSDHYFYGTADPDFATMYTRRNFETFGQAMVSVVQHTTNDGWSQIMMWYMNNSGEGAFVFFWLVHIVMAYVLVNLFVAIIMQNFSLEADVKLQRQVENYHRHSSRKHKQKNAEGEEEVSEAKAAKLAKSLYMFSPGHPVRVACIKVVKHPVYDFMMLFFVLFACWLVAWSGPQSSKTKDEKAFVDTANFVLWVIFTLEVVLKSIAFNFWVKPLGKIKDRPYLRRGPNRLDFLIVLLIGVSYVLMQFSGTLGNEVATFAKAMRALQPLRVLNRNKGLQRISNTLVVSLPAVGAVFGLLIIFWLCFAIVGVESFSGKMKRCVSCDDVYTVITRGTAFGQLEINTQDDCLGDVDLDGNGTTVPNFSYQPDGTTPLNCWENPPYNFDSFVHAMQSLFKASTMVGWIDMMESCSDARGVGLNPKARADDSHTFTAVSFFMAFNFVVNLFLMKLFVGVMASSFSSASGNNLVTEHQKKWIRVQRMVDEFNPKDSHETPSADKKLQLAAFRIAEHAIFTKVIDVCILLNIICLGVSHFPGSEFLSYLEHVNTFFLVVFTIELLVKVLAYGIKGYMAEAWNRMDLAVVAMSWFGRVAQVKSGAELARVFRTMRVFLIFHKVEGLTTLFSTVLAVLPSAFYMIVLILLLFFVYAILGMQLFGDEPTTHVHYNADNNFSDFSHSMKLLFQITVGQSLTYISHDLRHHGMHSVFLYFASFYFWSSYVMMNLFVGVLVDTFDLQHTPHGDDNAAPEFPPADMWTFREMWRDACVKAAEAGGYSSAIRGEAGRNPSLLELPFNQVYPLLLDLGEKKSEGGSGSVLHVRAQDPDWMYYTLLQAELYAFKIQPSMRIPGLSLAKSIAAYKGGGPKEEVGKYGPRGVGFHWLLKRLALRRLKKSTLMYQSLMDELETEREFVSQNIIAAMFCARILLKYGPEFCPAVAAYYGEMEDGFEPSAVWQKVSLGTFQAAVRGVRDLRISRLTRLRKLIEQEHAIAAMGDGDPMLPVNPETGSPMAGANGQFVASSPRVSSPRGMIKARKKSKKAKQSNTSIKVTNPMLAGAASASPMRGGSSSGLEEDLLQEED
jgi:hypothetical protein